MIPRWIQSLTEIDSFSRRQHPEALGHGMSRTVFAEGDKVYKICHFPSDHDENFIEVSRYVDWLKGTFTLPEGWAIPRMRLINGIVVADRIHGEDWENYLVGGGMTRREAWSYMDSYIAKHMPHTQDVLGYNVLVDDAGIHWAIDLGAEEIF